MFKILEKKALTPYVSMMRIFAPEVTRHAQPGQFVMLRVEDQGERIPLTIAEIQREAGSIMIIFQVVGATTFKLNQLQAGDMLTDFVGPLGQATDLKGISHALVIGGGVGCAIAYPLVDELHQKQVKVDTIIGFRQKDLVFLESSFQEKSDHLYVVTDDGSHGSKGFVTDVLRKLIEKKTYDKVFCIGPLPMMKAVSMITKEKNIPTIVSMNPIMIDGTGMCGGCRVRVGGKIQFACVDGPEFDGHQVDFDEAIYRNQMYHDYEKKAYQEACKLDKGASS
jgi:ferredoxin--NADP+ reductase